MLVVDIDEAEYLGFEASGFYTQKDHAGQLPFWVT